MRTGRPAATELAKGCTATGRGRRPQAPCAAGAFACCWVPHWAPWGCSRHRPAGLGVRAVPQSVSSRPPLTARPRGAASLSHLRPRATPCSPPYLVPPGPHSHPPGSQRPLPTPGGWLLPGRKAGVWRSPPSQMPPPLSRAAQHGCRDPAVQATPCPQNPPRTPEAGGGPEGCSGLPHGSCQTGQRGRPGHRAEGCLPGEARRLVPTPVPKRPTAGFRAGACPPRSW